MSYLYDWCKTKGKCGKYNYGGFYYWDKCEYLASGISDCTNLTWHKKQYEMWATIQSNISSIPIPGQLESLSGIITESVKTTFENEWDIMPAGRKKWINSAGVVCPFALNIQGSPFTGVFKNGTTHGLIRLGSAASIDPNSGVTPGGAVKIFRSGRKSANYVLLHNLKPLPNKNHNFFSVPISNHIPEELPLALNTLVFPKFCQAQSCVTKIGLSDASTYDQDGSKAKTVSFPFKVVTYRPILIILYSHNTWEC